jgi:transposase, IS5 family
VDSMVVETNIHHPTDSALLSDGVRVLSRLLRRAKKALPIEVAHQLGKDAFRTRNGSVRRVAQQLHRIARRKGEKAREQLKEAYRKLIYHHPGKLYSGNRGRRSVTRARRCWRWTPRATLP